MGHSIFVVFLPEYFLIIFWVCFVCKINVVFKIQHYPYIQKTTLLMASNDIDTRERERFAMDIRVFLAVITAAMAISFTVGVALGPSPDLSILPETTTKLPAVSSIEFDVKKLTDDASSSNREASGQVSCYILI
jgi:hypothetical protein